MHKNFKNCFLCLRNKTAIKFVVQLRFDQKSNVPNRNAICTLRYRRYNFRSVYSSQNPLDHQWANLFSARLSWSNFWLIVNFSLWEVLFKCWRRCCWVSILSRYQGPAIHDILWGHTVMRRRLSHTQAGLGRPMPSGLALVYGRIFKESTLSLDNS